MLVGDPPPSFGRPRAARAGRDENVADKKRYSKSDDSYKALGLGPDADRPAIQAAYRRLSVELRPENYPKDPEKQQVWMRVGDAISA